MSTARYRPGSKSRVSAATVGEIIMGGGVRKSLWLRAFLIIIFYLYDRTMGVHGKKKGRMVFFG